MNVLYVHIIGVSSCSMHDLALIKGSWYYFTSDNFQCDSHYKKLSERSDAEVVIEHERKKRGCGVMVDTPKVTLDDGFQYFSCLCHSGFQHPNFNELIFLQEAYKRGTLPYPGCLTDQPAQVLEIFSLLDNLQMERDIENRKKQEAEQKKAQPKKPPPRPKTR